MFNRNQQRSRLRVLHLVDSLRVGGKERQVIQLLKGLERLGEVSSTVVTMATDQFYVPDLEKLGVPLLYLLRRVRWDPTVFPRLLATVRQVRPQIIHTNSEMAMLYAWPLARLLGIKLVNGTIRNAFSGTGPRWRFHQAMLSCADARVANSRAGFRTRGLPHGVEGNYVVYNGLDLQEFQKRASGCSPGLGCELSNKKVVGMVAEFSDYKDFPTFIRAAQAVIAHRDDVIFLAVGGGKNLQACKSMALGEDRGIVFTGERKDVEWLVTQMDIGVLCTFIEGISNSVMEYMAAGKPAVVTDGGGSNELIVDGENGFLVPPSNPRMVADKVLKLLENPALSESMGQAGKVKIAREFSCEQLAKQTTEIYRTVLGARTQLSYS